MGKEVLKKTLVLVSISIFLVFSLILFDSGFSITGKAIYSDSGSDFDNGTYQNTTYNGTGVILSGSNLNGYYESRIFDAENDANWNNISFVYFTISNTTSYLTSAVHSGSNLSAFFSLDDFYYLADMKDESKRVFLNFSSGLKNGTVIHIYSKLNAGSTVGIYDVSDTSGLNPLGTFTVTSSTGDWYNVTLTNISSFTDSIWFGEGSGSDSDPKEEFDYVYASTSGSNLIFDFKNCTLSNCNDGVWQTLDNNNLNLTGRFFQYRVNFSRASTNLNGILINSSINYELINEAPTIQILSPQEDATYGYNESLELNYSVSDINDNLDSCFYNINGGANITLPSCNNITFDVSGNGDYQINLFSNDTLGEVGIDSLNFTVQIGAPTVILNQPNNNVYLNYTNITFIYTPSDIDLSSCSLYGNFTGDFLINQTNNFPINQSQNTFNLNLSDGTYNWNVECNDTLSNSAFNGNKTFVIDTTNPNVVLNEPIGVKSSRTVDISFSAVDLNLDSCFYSVYRGGSIEISNTTVDCSNPGNFDLTLDADFVFVLYVNDSSGNIVRENSSFSVDTTSSTQTPSSGGGGGGGGGGTIVVESNITKNDLELNFEPIKGILIPNEEKSLTVSVTNDGESAVNKCQIRSNNDELFESSLISNIASGEIIDFPIIIKVVDEVPLIYIECVEGKVDIPLDFVIYETTLGAQINKIDLGENEITLEYTLDSDFGFDDVILFEIKDSSGNVIQSNEESVSFGSEEEFFGLITLNIPDNVETGLFTISIIYDENILVDDTFLYGSSIVTGFVAREIVGDGTKLLVWSLLVLFNVAAFFVIRKVWINSRSAEQIIGVNKINNNNNNFSQGNSGNLSNNPLN